MQEAKIIVELNQGDEAVAPIFRLLLQKLKTFLTAGFGYVRKSDVKINNAKSESICTIVSVDIAPVLCLLKKAPELMKRPRNCRL